MINPVPMRLSQFDSLTFSNGPQNGRNPLRNPVAIGLSLLLPLAVLFKTTGLLLIHHLLISIALTTFWQIIFARNRGQRPGLDLVTTGLLFALLLPEGFSGVQLMLGISFGVVVGEQLYGGRGYSFLHPVIAGLAFLLYSFPSTEPAINNLWLSAALIPGLVLLLVCRVIDWRSLTGLLIAVFIIHLALTRDLPITLPSSVVLAGVLLTTLDPTIGTSTQQGRWWYGALVGALMVFIDTSLQSIHAIVFASLLGSIAAPLIDWLVIRFKTQRSRTRHE